MAAIDAREATQFCRKAKLDGIAARRARARKARVNKAGFACRSDLHLMVGLLDAHQKTACFGTIIHAGQPANDIPAL